MAIVKDCPGIREGSGKYLSDNPLDREEPGSVKLPSVLITIY
ncbi:MAG: hypothetical protein ACMUIG_09685 [Thermoplasmatota archaeon]